MKRITDNPFQADRQRGHEKLPPNPCAFSTLPTEIVGEIGLWTHKGARVDAAFLAGLVYHARRNAADDPRSIPTTAGEVTLLPGEFWVSELTIAEDLWSRWFFLPPDAEPFKRFYNRMPYIARRLADRGLVQKVRLAGGAKTLGSVWSFEGTPLEPWIHRLEGLAHPRGTILHQAAAGLRHGLLNADDPTINVVDLIGSAFVSEHYEMFTHAEMAYSLTSRGVYHDALTWVQHVAERGASGTRYASVGAIRPEDIGRANPPVFFYWFPLDIDRDDPEEAFEDTKDILLDLEDEYEVPLHELIVSYTGGKGFHVRIPSGMMGNPVFENIDEGSKTLKALVSGVFGIEADPAVFNGKQLLRLVGSQREENGRYHRAWRGDEFVLLRSFDYDILRACAEFEAFMIPDPREAEAVPDLMLALVAASDLTRRAAMPGYADYEPFSAEDTWRRSGVIEAALKGCEQGEVWYDKGGRFHVGRNKLVFVAACHHLREFEGDEDTAWEATLITNSRCSPPMREREVRRCFKNAVKAVTGESRRYRG